MPFTQSFEFQGIAKEMFIGETKKIRLLKDGRPIRLRCINTCPSDLKRGSRH